ncbi:ATP-binding protein [Crocinitomicaceae bacterium]|nr:ATP-binding protein [Crocinitomicaceae bacterium]
MGFSFTFTLFVHLFISKVDSTLFFIIPILGAVFVYITFSLLLRKFVEHRLSLLYRSIQTKAEDTSVIYEDESLDSMIENAEKDVQDWQSKQDQEIVKLKEQETFRREFLGNLAHELKTPVFSIQGYILTLLEGGLEDETINKKFLERASVSTDRIVSVLEDLDQITKLEIDALEMHFESFDILKLASECIEGAELNAKEKNITLSLKNSTEEIYVNADRKRIAQVLTNLLNNSISYGKENGQTTVSIFIIDDLVTIEIADNGIGIEKTHFSRLFERFYRVEKSRNRHEGGTGLGLAIVKHVIDSHQQKIAVKSSVGVGSQFTFSLDKA